MRTRDLFLGISRFHRFPLSFLSWEDLHASLRNSVRSPLDFYLSFKRHFGGRLETDAVTRIGSETNLLTDDKAAVSL